MRPPEFWNHSHGRAAAPLTRAVLTPFSWIYDLLSRWRRSTIPPHHLPVPVICVGNISMGGTGKTPLAICLAKQLIADGKNPAFVSRGFGGKKPGPIQVDPEQHPYTAVGDEPLLLAKIAPTFVGRDRVAAAKLAAQSGADCIILDDGFQNPSLAKDVSILVVDAHIGHGNGHIFPAGPLREQVAHAVARADAVVLVGDETKPVPLPGFSGSLYRAKIQPTHAPPQGKLIAFAGIGRPEKFFGSLREAGADVEQEIAFADHHVYTKKDIKRLLAWQKSGTQLITTSKDLIRWPKQRCRDVLDWPIELVFENPDDVQQLLQGIYPPCT